MTVTFESSGTALPSGMYPRRLFSYLCKHIVTSRAKQPIIQLPRTKNQFLREALGIDYAPSKSDMATINKHIQALCECLLTISYSNPNDKARKPRDRIKFFADDCAWLYDDSHDWQRELILSEELFDLIRYSAVPISASALATFTNARKLDIFNYFTYQNYNLQLKKMDYVFEIEELFNLFAGDIPEMKEFRRSLKNVLSDLEPISYLDIAILNKYQYKLFSNEESLLKRKKRRLIHTFTKPIAINEDSIDQLKKEHDPLNVEAARNYMLKRSKNREIRHPFAYIKDILKNPRWYWSERESLIEQIAQEQKIEYDALSREMKNNVIEIFRMNLNYYGSSILKLPAEHHNTIKQLKHPGSEILKGGLPSAEYTYYLLWCALNNKRMDFKHGTTAKALAELFKLWADEIRQGIKKAGERA